MQPGLAADPASGAEGPPSAPRRTGLLLALGLGVAGTAVSAAGSWIPSFWGDEAASIMSASRPLGSLIPMLLNVDAVHGAHYVFLHFWIGLFGASEFSVRFPSAIALGFTVAGLVLLTMRLAGPRAALFAGITCAILPRLTLMGTETRVYAISAACAVWLTLLLVRLLTETSRPPRWGWAAYSLGVAISIYLYLYLALMIVVHAIVLATSPHPHRMRRAFALASARGIGLALPVIVLAVIQRNQVAFLATRQQTRPDRMVIVQWFGDPWFAALAWLLIAALVGAWATSRRDHRRNGPRPGDPRTVLAGGAMGVDPDRESHPAAVLAALSHLRGAGGGAAHRACGVVARAPLGVMAARRNAVGGRRADLGRTARPESQERQRLVGSRRHHRRTRSPG